MNRTEHQQQRVAGYIGMILAFLLTFIAITLVAPVILAWVVVFNPGMLGEWLSHVISSM